MTFNIQWGGLHRVISGGQTGADQGGLLAAWKEGVETGGMAPWMYQTSTGPNPLLEVLGLSSPYGATYNSRTKANILTSDATVIIAYNMGSPGTVLTRKCLLLAEKPFLELDLSDQYNGADGIEEVKQCIEHAEALVRFITKHQVQVLNVAGNREINGTQFMASKSEFIVGQALRLLALGGKLMKTPSSGS